MCGQNFPVYSVELLDADDRDFMDKIDLNTIIEQFDRELCADPVPFSDLDSEIRMVLG